MRKLLTAMAAGLSFMAASAAQATVLTFETPVTDYFENFVGPYPGLTFQYFKTINATNFPESGYTHVLTSGNQVACGCASDYGETVSSISSDTPFDFIGGVFASAWNEDALFTVYGYRDGTLVYGSQIFLRTTPWARTFYFMGVDRVEFSISGGTPNTELINNAHVGGGDYFAVDDLVINFPGAVPEPATWAMMLAGFGALGGALRRQRVGSMRLA